jgi:hypothetical protein
MKSISYLLCTISSLLVLLFSFLFQNFIFGAYSFGSFVGVAFSSFILSLLLRKVKVNINSAPLLVSSLIMFVSCYCLIKIYPIENIRDFADVAMPYFNAIIMTVIYLIITIAVIRFKGQRKNETL